MYIIVVGWKKIILKINVKIVEKSFDLSYTYSIVKVEPIE